MVGAEESSKQTRTKRKQRKNLTKAKPIKSTAEMQKPTAGSSPGRFTQRDIANQKNRYDYARTDPINNHDPSGH